MALDSPLFVWYNVYMRRKPRPLTELVALYKTGLSVDKIGRQIGGSGAAVWRRLRDAGTKMRPSGYPSFPGASNGNWRGGRYKRAAGYIRVVVNPNKTMLEHRHVMELHLGRKLERHEHVHHINGIRDDNRTENLRIISPKLHKKGTLVRLLQDRIRELERR